MIAARVDTSYFARSDALERAKMSDSPGLLDGFTDLATFAKTVNRHPRTVARWLDRPGGLPHTKLGNKILVYLPGARAWLFENMRHRNPRRRSAAGGY
jgi:hypothetical protein